MSERSLRVGSRMITAVAFDVAQAKTFSPPPGPHDAWRILALGPAARQELADRGFTASSTTEAYTDDDHRAVALEAGRIRDIVFDAAKANFGESSSLTHRLVDLTVSLYLPAARLWATLGSRGPWYCLSDQWRVVETKEEAFQVVLRSIIPDGPVHVTRFASYRGEWLIRFLQSLLLKRASRWPQWLISNRGRMQFGLKRGVRRNGDKMCVPGAPVGFGADLNLVFGQLMTRKLPEAASFVVGWSDAQLDAKNDAIITATWKQIDNPVLSLALGVSGEDIRGQVLGFARAEQEIDRIVAAIRPRVAVSYQLNNQLASAIWTICERRQVPRIVAHHNSLCDATNSDAAANRSMAVTTERHYSLVPSDIYLAFSPIHKRCLEMYLPRSRGRIEAFRMAPRPDPHKPNKDVLRVLLSDNYMEWRDHLPVIMQTSDELLDSILECCSVAGNIDGVRLVIRVKPKKELHPPLVASLTAGMPNVEISDYATPFKRELERADVVIASMSTTIEEAFEYGIPVILYGKQQRYSHLRDLPDSLVAGRLYRAKSKAELATAIRAIQAKHGSNSSAARLSQLVWSEETPTADDLRVLA